MTTLLQELDEVLEAYAEDDSDTRAHMSANFLTAHAPEIRAALELKARVDAGLLADDEIPTPRYVEEIEFEGRGYVLVPPDAYERLYALAAAARTGE